MIKYQIFILLFLSTIICSSCTKTKQSRNNVLWISSNPSAQWQIDSITSDNVQANSKSRIQVFPDSTQQIIDGFGACFNELGWEALNSLSAQNQQEVLQSLFSIENGCRFNICRMPIGANDYAVNWYSHNETDGDFEMTNFSINRDMERLIPYIKRAKSINPDLQIWASPWCPPSWMKTNNHYACKPDDVNDLTEAGRGEEMVTQFIMQDNYLKAYALYFSKFIRAYQNQGINIYAIHVQNEPNSCQNFPSCVWNPRDLSVFIGDYLGPKFLDDNLKTQIWLGTIERPHIERVDDILNYNDVMQYITGVGFQWAGKGAIPKVYQKYPNLKLMQTETECGDGSNDWEAAEYTFSLMKHYFNNGANSYMYWNMILDETGKSQWGWKQNSMITVNKAQKAFTFNPEFYLMKHFSAIIEPGSHFIKTSDDNCLAFKNSQEHVVIYYHAGENNIEKEFSINEVHFKANLTPRSFNTFRVII